MYSQADEDKNLEELMEATKALLNAAKGENVDEIGRQIAKRQICIDSLKAGGGISGNRTEAKQSLLDELMPIDREACAAIRDLMQKYGLKALKYKKKVSGLLQYNNSMFNLASGQLIDRRK